MTRVLGVLKGQTVSGKQIRNGNAALAVFENGALQLSALGEERVTRVKHEPGFQKAMHELLWAAEMKISDVDIIAISSCCEPRSKVSQSGLDPLVGRRGELVTVGHHDSHATLSFLGSGFSDGLVLVADGGGDVLDEDADSDWWRHKREQLTVYSASANGLEAIGRDFDEPYALGFGEFFRAVTYFLGWQGSRFASRSMALASYSPTPEWPDVFEWDGTRLGCLVEQDPMAPIDVILRIGQEIGVNLGEPRKPHSEILEIHRQLAAYAQSQLNKFMHIRAEHALRETGHRNLSLGGGVALNVVTNGHLRRSLDAEVYVSSAPGDEGQALGNALSVLWEREPEALRDFRMTRSSAAYLGPPRKVDSASIAKSLLETECTNFAVFEYTSSAEVVAAVLDASSAVAVFQGRSEYGPRALGNRSILGNPRIPWGRALFNQVKNRNWFMPFAPVALSRKSDLSDMESIFGAVAPSPFMSFAANMEPGQPEELPAVTAIDGTARVQTLGEGDSDAYLSGVVAHFEQRSGVPVVLNTSFNGAGEPIVETLTDAVRSFSKLPVNILSAGRFLIVKSLSPELMRADVMPANFPVKVYSHQIDGSRRDLQIDGVPANEAIRLVQREVGRVVFIRSELPLFGPYLTKLRQGKKVTTIRFRANAVELPAFSRIPLFETEDFGVGDRSKPTATVRIKSLRYQVWGTLNAEDAARDGFDSYADMRRDLQEIYPKMKDTDWVTIYEIVLADPLG